MRKYLPTHCLRIDCRFLIDLLKKLFFTLGRPQLKNHYIDKAYEWAMQQTYDKLAIEWENIFDL